MQPVSTPFRPIEAFRALRKLVADPTDTAQAFRVVRNLDGPIVSRTIARFMAHPVGGRLMATRSSLLDALRDRAALARLPEGSLGRAYLAFCDREGITPGGLVAASDEVELAAPEGSELRYFADRMRDSHDLWHVVTGYRTDLPGELSVLTFSLAQSPGPGLLVLVLGGLSETMKFGELGVQTRRLVRDAWRTGRRAAWFPAVPWEEWLARPLEDVRIELGIMSVPVYRATYANEIYAAA